MTLGLSEKYRPTHLSEILGNEDVLSSLKNMLKQHQRLPPMMFIGPSGTGKTTTARALAFEKYGEGYEQYYTEMNASVERGIDVVRGKIKSLSQTYGDRILCLDEADSLTNDAQFALRGIIQESVDTTFILTGNYEDKFIEALSSRCVQFHFKPLKEAQILERLTQICDLEGIQFNPTNDSERQQFQDGIVFLAQSSHGDLRHAINILERLIGEGKQITIDEISLLSRPKPAVEMVVTALRGNFERARQMLEDSLAKDGMNPQDIINELFQAIPTLNVDGLTEEVKIRLFIRLAEVEARLRHGNRGLIQLTALLASAWLYPHLSSSVRREEIF